MIMTILKAPELARFAAIAACVGLPITLTAVRFAPIHRRAITDRRQSHTAAAGAVAPTTSGGFGGTGCPAPLGFFSSGPDAASCRDRSTR
jgi:hypothetical protein